MGERITRREGDALIALDRAAFEDPDGWTTAAPVADDLGVGVFWTKQRLESFVTRGWVERHPTDRHRWGITERGAMVVEQLEAGARPSAAEATTDEPPAEGQLDRKAPRDSSF